jgi:hypothetical protein
MFGEIVGFQWIVFSGVTKLSITKSLSIILFSKVATVVVFGFGSEKSEVNL